MPIKFRVLIALGTIVLPLCAQKTRNSTVAEGRKEFEKTCGFCHGADATGSRAPDLIRSAVVSHDRNGDLLGPLIRNGRPDKGMPPIAMSDTQVAGIAAFLHARVKEAMGSNKVPKDYPEEKLLTGNAAAGKAYFNGAGGCAGCHSPTGDLAGIGKKYSPLDLQSRFLYPAGRKPAATVTTASGSKVTGTLLALNEFNVAVRDASGWYHSWDRATVKVDVKDPLEAHRKLLPKYTDKDMHDLFAYLETLK
jgi:cytochrome c oxidase cbb3-type subunit III